MASPAEEERAHLLARSAAESIRAGHLSDAARTLREATSTAPENATVQATWATLKQEQDHSPLLDACRKWMKTRDDKQDGERALERVRGQRLSYAAAEQAMHLLLQCGGESDTLDSITAELLQYQSAQQILARRLQEHPTATFYQLFERGDGSMDGVLRVLLNRSAWPSNAEFIQGHRDAFMLSLAMMMEEALDHPERAMKGIAGLLTAHAPHLNGIIDSDGFEVILSSLDIRLPVSLRSQATLASVKLLELAPENAQNLISTFVTSRVSTSTTDGLIVAFSAAAAIFPVATPIAAALFLTDGFVSGLLPLVQAKRSQKLEQAALELISTACIDKTCRDTINRHCRAMLEDIVATTTDERNCGLAAVVMVKLGDEPLAGGGPQAAALGKINRGDLLSRFRATVINLETSHKQDAIEGLAYASLQPKVREELANDGEFLSRLNAIMAASNAPNFVLFGGLTILINLTAYLPIQSDEEKRMAQLKAYANTTKPADPDPLQGEAFVSKRCSKVLDSGIVPLLAASSKRASLGVLSQMMQLLLSLSQAKTHRGLMAQQGCVKLALQVWERTIAPEHAHAPSNFSGCSRDSAHVLARILISVNPHHVFFAASALPSSSAIRPLISLFEPDRNGSADTPPLLATFEALLALTNLASMDDDTRVSVGRLAWDKIHDDFVLSSNTLIRRAAVELICNLVASPLIAERLAESSSRARARLRILLAMADVDDASTRSAAGGALAMLLGWQPVLEAVLMQERGVDLLLGLCKDGSEEIRHRGVVCIQSLVSTEMGKSAVRQRKGVEVVRELVRASRHPEVIHVGADTLQALLAD